MASNMLLLLRKALPIGMLIVGWFGRATQDGKITLVELIELAQAVIVELDINVEIDIPPEVAGTLGLAPPSPGGMAVVGTVTAEVVAGRGAAS